ncbi:MAG TPA: AraC family transcriptional regulator [Hyphomonadaceae bacterium]|nr:AraC family transcriptional regulator [Hyphomonadaceae bacterium]
MAPAAHHSALELISVEVTNRPPPATAEISSRDTLITAPWLHPATHSDVPALPVHLIATYFGHRGKSTFSNGRFRIEGIGRPGTLAIVPAYFWGRWDVPGEAPLSYLLLSEFRLREFADQNLARGRPRELIPRLGEADPVGTYIMRVLSRSATRPELTAGMLIQQTLDLLCSHLLRVHASSVGTTVTSRRGLLPWQVRRVTNYMCDRLDMNITLDELAALLDLSRFHFCTAFRLATGQTPHDWLTERRMQRAREMLEDLETPVIEIALAVGYSTPSAFSASFRRATGLTPTDYRRRL